MRTSSPRNALAFLGDKLQAKRDEVYLEEYRKQAHAALLKDPLSTSFTEEPDIVHTSPRIKSVIKYSAQNPGDGSSFSSSNQVLYYSPVNPSAEHGRSSNSPRRRPSEFAQAQDGSATSARGGAATTSPRRPSGLGRATIGAAERTQSVSAALHMAAMLTSRSSQEREISGDDLTSRSATSATMHRSGNTTKHWMAVHWDTDMQGQQTILRPGLASQKAMNYPPPRPSTAPTAPQPRMPRKSLTNLSSSNSSLSLDSGTSSSRSEGSDSHDSGSESSSDSESRQESDADHPRLRRRAHEHKRTASDQLPEPLRKLQQQSFSAGGTHADPMAEPSGLVWQDSGFMIPFTPEMFGPKGGQHRQISTAATGVTSVPGRGSQRLTLASSRQSSSAHALASSAASQAAAPSASALRASRGSLVMQLSHHSQLTQAVLSELALQQPEAPPAAMQHSSPSSTAFRQGLDLQNMSGDARKHRGKAVSSAACESGPGGKRRKKKGRHAVDPAMDHVEEQLQILKHVHVKHASPRTMVANTRRAEELGLAALPATLGGPLAATWGSATLGRLPASAPAGRPVVGHNSWYQTGLHVLPQELDAAVLEALAAEAAGIKTGATGKMQRPATSPGASYKMRMEANMQALVYDEKLDAPNAGPKHIPAINPNRAYLKSLAQGSAKKHFQSVEVDLREAHRRLIATSKDLQPVTYASAAKTPGYA